MNLVIFHVNTQKITLEIFLSPKVHWKTMAVTLEHSQLNTSCIPPQEAYLFSTDLGL